MKHREYELDIRMSGATATIRQVRSKFKFGSNIFALALYEGDRLDAYRKRIIV